MGALSVAVRNQLARAIQNARREAEAGARRAVEALGVHLGKAPDWMDGQAEKLELRRRLRAHGRQVGDHRSQDGKLQEIDCLSYEVAYQHWHRMLFARFLSENHLLVEPQSGVAISMSECEELAREQGVDSWALAAGFAQHMLPAIFRQDDPALEVVLAPETRQALEREVADLPVEVFTSDDGLGWTYQFWQADRKDQVNESGVKIGAAELPAVTQLFTEHYMVLFLLHNTIGSWWAARKLSERPDLTTAAHDEDELRRAVRLDAAAGYDFDYLRFVRDERNGAEPAGTSEARWRVAAGAFDGWPRVAAELRVLDPCCGSGHFLVEAFSLVVRLRITEEGLKLEDAIRRVLRENIFGLEIDPRCTQIAAFNLAMAAWKLAGKPIALPSLNVACSGLAPNTSKDEWLSLADAVAAEGGLPARADMFDRDESLWTARVRQGLSSLFDLFAKAPTLGSLIDPATVRGDLLQVDFRELEPLLAPLLERQRTGRDRADEEIERAVSAQGMARAGAMLARGYTLVVTNVPYLGRGKQDDVLKAYLDDHFGLGKADLATAFVQRTLQLCEAGGTAALVTPQNWLFLTSYRKLRDHLLRRSQWNLVGRLGEHAFESHEAAGAFAAVFALSNRLAMDGALIAGVDVSAPRGKKAIRANEKAHLLSGRHGVPVTMIQQSIQLGNPDARIVLGSELSSELLASFANSSHGIGTFDSMCFSRNWWEIQTNGQTWVLQQSTPSETMMFGGCNFAVRWENGAGLLAALMAGKEAEGYSSGKWRAGHSVWGTAGVLVGQMNDLPATMYLGAAFDENASVVVPTVSTDLPALWSFVSSPSFRDAIRALDDSIKVTCSTLVKVPFDVVHWRDVADKEFPVGLPLPESDDPTQWVFHGRPEFAECPEHVAVARLLGHRWPAELNSAMLLSARARLLVDQCGDLAFFPDRDGIVCIPSVRGEKPAADRLLSLLSACGARSDRDLDEWLRSRFFEEHCRLFHHRPFIWHVWDGRDDGFHALVNYHRLVGPNGEGRRTLEALTFSYLGDWIERQKAGQRAGEAGADGRLAAALDLQGQLEQILAGEPPYDIFVRWKPLHEQPMGWDPDINDGVRLNIRPFLSAELRKGGRKGAGILRWKPNIKWTKDRGTDPESIRPRDEYPWFWSCAGDGTLQERTDFRGGATFDGSRWNDLHYTTRVRRAARER